MIKGSQHILQQLKETSPFLNQFLEEDVGVFVYSRDSLIKYTPGATINLQIAEGSPVVPGSIPDRCMSTGKKMVLMISREKSRCGIAYLSCATPVSAGNKVIGCVITNQSLETHDKVSEAANSVGDSSQNLSAAMEEVSAQVEELVAGVTFLGNLGKDLQQQINQTDNIIVFIKNLAEQTNLLGLNASIEAARVGKEGLGFGVVANEIRKLSQSSKNSTKQITEQLNLVQNEINQLSERVSQIEMSMQQVSTVIQEVTSTSVSLAATANNLSSFANNMYHITGE